MSPQRSTDLLLFKPLQTKQCCMWQQWGEQQTQSLTGLRTPLLFCQQGLAVEICNYIFKALDHIGRKDSYLLQSKMLEISVRKIIKAVCLVFQTQKLVPSSPQNNIGIILINNEIHFFFYPLSAAIHWIHMCIYILCVEVWQKIKSSLF